jgi:hypothetical protein
MESLTRDIQGKDFEEWALPNPSPTSWSVKRLPGGRRLAALQDIDNFRTIPL